MSGFSLVAGILALIAGLGEFLRCRRATLSHRSHRHRIVQLSEAAAGEGSYVDQCRPLPLLWTAVHEGSESRRARDLPM